MATDPTLAISGNLIAAPELRFTPAGVAVANFTIASTPRVFDRNTNEWKDGDALFVRCNAWRKLGEHAAESLARGARVLVTGRLKQRNYETREGEKRSVVELDIDDIGASLMFATAKITRANADAQNGRASFGGGDPRTAAPLRETVLADGGPETPEDQAQF
ncbi:single-stranded DNA-binding protein [Nocardia fluminea]|uniref:single-stranded DNA-binding protein n=1 Tax=Nocardia TaxID=1817 RepID=UPI00265A4B9B|nr:single-stranded DNA-binding protein [Nocardia sp. PE-7]WKG08817.1 single-stranded DNA-binding protein [Nocardia sp. PE-7]